MALEIVSEACGFQEHFNISGLAVTDDKKTKTAGKNLQCFLKIRIQRSTFAKQCFMLCLAAAVDDTKLFCFRKLREKSPCDIRQQLAKKPHQSFGAYIGIHVFRMDKVIAPGLSYDPGGIPERTVNIKNNTVHQKNLPKNYDM